MKCICLILLPLFWFICSSFSEKIVVGYLTGSQRKPGDNIYPRLGQTISGAISYAVQQVNQNHPLVQNISLDFVVAETFGRESESIRQTAKLWMDGNVSAFIGPQETCVHEARMAASFNLPMISYFCAHPETSNKDFFPTFARTRPPDTQISKSVASVLLKFSWHRVALIYSATETATRNYEAIARTIHATLSASNIEVRYMNKWTSAYYHGYTENPFTSIVDDSYNKARIYIVIGDYFEHLGMLLSLLEKGLLTKGEYFVVGVDVEQYDPDRPDRYFSGILKNDVFGSVRERAGESLVEKAFQSYLGVFSSPPSGFDNFAVQVNRYMQMPPFQFLNPVKDLGGLRHIPAEAAYLYDAVFVYAKALNETLKAGQDVRDGKIIFDRIKGNIYQSALGFLVSIDKNGDASGNYTLIARKRKPSSTAPTSSSAFGLYPVGVFQMPNHSYHIPYLQLWSEIDWISEFGVPRDEPACGFDGEQCQDPPLKWILALVTTIIVISLIVSIALYKGWVYEQELDSLLWKIDVKDVVINDIPLAPKSNKTKYSSQVSLNSACDLMEFRYYNVYTKIGLYKGRLVALKMLYKKSLEITRKIKKELKMMRDLRHENLNTFMGVSIESSTIYVLSEYASRGSLWDVLQNTEVHLDNIFIASMIGDIIRVSLGASLALNVTLDQQGMIYIHDSSIGFHGNLKSSNCLVDSRWTVKISDFGLHQLKQGTENEPATQNNSVNMELRCEKLLWKAPEILRDQLNNFSRGTQKGDVYSFGIILYEILGRSGPWGTINLSPSEIVKRVITRTYGIEPFRPGMDIITVHIERENTCCIGTEDATEKIRYSCLQVMLSAWAENPDERPDFKTIRTRLQPIKKGMKSNIMDNMLELMERYTNNLEALVDERTDQLVEEKKKTEALLYDMLPKPVADQLRKGSKIEAESFDCVTIFFSDIVGFTNMSAISTPLQVVELLNDLYTLFDSIIESYDVYKVETIGDSYMVVSGLPIRNGDLHGAEIASMALSLVDAVQKFTIRHLPNHRLVMRVGIHSGPVCAGVVGLKMPRYCLFGDTVNTASRMETTSLPLKIHCSECFKNVLDKIGGYELVERGVIEVKGKGEMKTFWLVGQKEDKCMRKNVKVLNYDPSFNHAGNYFRGVLSTRDGHQLRKQMRQESFSGFRTRNAMSVGAEYLNKRRERIRNQPSSSSMKRSCSHDKGGDTTFDLLMNRKSVSTTTSTGHSLSSNEYPMGASTRAEKINSFTSLSPLSPAGLKPGFKTTDASPISDPQNVTVQVRDRSGTHLAGNILHEAEELVTSERNINRSYPRKESVKSTNLMRMNPIQKMVQFDLKEMILKRVASFPAVADSSKISRSESVPFLREGHPKINV